MNFRVSDILSILITLGFFAVLSYVLAYGVPEKGGDSVMVLLGSLGAGWTAIIGYHFGSSAGSAAKSTQIDKLMNKDGE